MLKEEKKFNEIVNKLFSTRVISSMTETEYRILEKDIINLISKLGVDYINDKKQTLLLRMCSMHNEYYYCSNLIKELSENDKLGREFTQITLNSLDNNLIKKRHLKIIKILLKHGASINHKIINNQGQHTTPLIEAVRNNYLDLVKLFINKGGNVHEPWIFDRSLLYISSRNNNLDMTKYLIKNGCDINKKSNYEDGEWAPLSLAILEDNLNIAKLIIKEKTTNLNILNRFKQTPLQIAIERNKKGIIKLLK